MRARANGICFQRQHLFQLKVSSPCVLAARCPFLTGIIYTTDANSNFPIVCVCDKCTPKIGLNAWEWIACVTMAHRLYGGPIAKNLNGKLKAVSVYVAIKMPDSESVRIRPASINFKFRNFECTCWQQQQQWQKHFDKNSISGKEKEREREKRTMTNYV